MTTPTPEQIEEHKRRIEVMQAWPEKEIEAKYRLPADGSWVSYKDCASGPSWDWASFDYRIKPSEPRRVWVQFDEGGRPIDVLGYRWSVCPEFIELTPEVRAKLGL